MFRAASPTSPALADETQLELPNLVQPQPVPPRPPNRWRRRAALGSLIATSIVLVVVWWAGRTRSAGGVAQPPLNGSVALAGKRTEEMSSRDIAALARAATVQVRALGDDRALLGNGTGFFLSKDGLIGTNLHVIRGARTLQVKTLSGRVHDAVLYVTSDPRRDIAILKIPVDDARPLSLALDPEIDVGERVYVMGNPLGQLGTFSDGLLSSRRTVEGVSLLQITAPVSPGSSGGPVLNARGEVVGMATLMLRGGQNLNYAVPARFIRPLLASKQAPRQFAAELLPSDTTGLAGLDAESRRGNVVGGDPSYGHVPGSPGLEAVAKQFIRADSLMQRAGGEAVTRVQSGSLNDGESTDHDFTLEAGRKYVIVGYCDMDCADLDLRLFTAAGKLLSSDVEPNDNPSVRVVSKTSGPHRLTVTMRRCSAEPCVYGVRLYRF